MFDIRQYLGEIIIQTTQTFFQRECHKSLEYPGQMPALNDRKPSDFPDWQSPPEEKKKLQFLQPDQTLRTHNITQQNFRAKLCFTYLDFTAPYLPPLCVFHSGLCIFNVVVQDKGHSFHSVKYNLRKTEENRVPCCQKVNNGQL